MGAVAGTVATAVEAGLLLEAKAAPDGSRLGKTNVTERSVTAFDLTFSAPKSVSVLYALGDARMVAAVEAAHTGAVVQSTASLSLRIAHCALRTRAPVMLVSRWWRMRRVCWGSGIGIARVGRWIRNFTITC